MRHEISNQIITLRADHLLAHYLDRETWGQEWLLFKHGPYSLIAFLDSIDVIGGSIVIGVEARFTTDSAGSGQSEYDRFSLPIRDDVSQTIFDRKLSRAGAAALDSLNRSIYRQTNRYRQMHAEQRQILADARERYEEQFTKAIPGLTRYRLDELVRDQLPYEQRWHERDYYDKHYRELYTGATSAAWEIYSDPDKLKK